MRKGDTFLTPKRREVFLSMLAASRTVEEAARAVGVNRITAYNWRKRDPDFKREWEEAVDVSVDKVEAGLIRAAEDGDITASIFLLRNRKPETYNPNLVLRREMLKLALEKARAELNGPPLIEGQAIRSDRTLAELQPITVFAMPANLRAASSGTPHFARRSAFSAHSFGRYSR
jgi:hypothetical protein